MGRLDNLFAAVRTSRDEVQLSAMFAHVLHHEPARRVLERIADVPHSSVAPSIDVERAHEAGRCDIWVETDRYLVIIENKIDAPFRPRQLEDYAGQLPHDKRGRVLVLTPLPGGYVFHEDAKRDLFVEATWSQIAVGLRVEAADADPVSRHILTEFIAMLEDDRLAAPRLTSEGVVAWSAGFDVYRWAWSLLSVVRGEWQKPERAPDFAPLGQLQVISRPNMVMWSENTQVRVGIGFQLQEARLFVIAYPPRGMRATWSTLDAVQRLGSKVGWSRTRWEGLEAFHPLRELANNEDSWTAAANWIHERVSEILAAGFELSPIRQ